MSLGRVIFSAMLEIISFLALNHIIRQRRENLGELGLGSNLGDKFLASGNIFFGCLRAHEIKNPLAGIAGAVQVIADELPEADSRKEIMREILSQVHRLDRTVRDLLAFARPGKPEISPCDIHQVLDRVLLLLAESPEAKDVRVVRAYQPGIPFLPADGKQLGQVFLNLILNAVQAMPGGGSITIATRLFERGQLVESSSSQLARTRDPGNR